LDTKRFGPRLVDMEDITNHILESYNVVYIDRN